MTERDLRTRPAVGIDLGGTKLAVGLLAGEVAPWSEPDRLLTGYRTVPVETHDYEATLDSIADHVTELRTATGHTDPAVGLAIAAFLSPDRAEVVEALNLGWHHKNVRDDLARRIGAPVILHNDGNAAAWGEYLLAGRPAGGSMVIFTLGTDVGGGVIAEGRLLTGAFGIGGELGHLVVDPGGPQCVCGARGCLAVFASGKAITARAREALGQDGEPVDVSALNLTRLAEAGDPRVLAVLDAAARAIAAASAQLSRVLDQHTLVIGGGAGRLGEPLLAALRTHLALGVPVGPVLPLPAVRPARAGDRAGVLGVAALARAEPAPS